MREMTFSRAINKALGDALAADHRVILLGEDIGIAGGCFGVSKGLHDRFGAARIMDTPISEAVITGAAIGAAMSGLRPVVEIMFMDFTTLAMDALVNQAAKAHFMFGGHISVPIVIRTQHGGGVNAGPQHSQCLEAWFAHVPGLKLVCPSEPSSAYGLLRSAIEDPDPVIFIENKALYSMKTTVFDDETRIPIGKAATVRHGRDVTVVTYGAAVNLAVLTGQQLAEQGLEIEIIDLRTLQPWDEAMVLESVSRTHKLVLLHEAVEAFGIGAEIAARMADIGFNQLEAPIVRVGAPFMPVPFASSLEEGYLPSVARLEKAVMRVLRHPTVRHRH
jgi:acetoin:2,6-dichlorophenolindophenol oxidoreductase subunit beta